MSSSMQSGMPPNSLSVLIGFMITVTLKCDPTNHIATSCLCSVPCPHHLRHFLPDKILLVVVKTIMPPPCSSPIFCQLKEWNLNSNSFQRSWIVHGCGIKQAPNTKGCRAFIAVSSSDSDASILEMSCVHFETFIVCKKAVLFERYLILLVIGPIFCFKINNCLSSWIQASATSHHNNEICDHRKCTSWLWTTASWWLLAPSLHCASSSMIAMITSEYSSDGMRHPFGWVCTLLETISYPQIIEGSHDSLSCGYGQGNSSLASKM
jgi:hypothetical protein